MSTQTMLSVQDKIAIKLAKIDEFEKRKSILDKKISNEHAAIESLKNLEIKNALKELNLPFNEVIQLLKDLKK